MPGKKTPFVSPKTEKGVLKEYVRPIVHLRAQYHEDKLGLVFGAGVNVPLRIPKWETLIEQIAKHEDVKGITIRKKALSKKKSHSAITQILFQKFRDKFKKKKGWKNLITSRSEKQINTEWLKLVHGILYSKYIDDEKLLKRNIKGHPYLKEFVDIIKKMPMTVTYNFDDILQYLVLDSRTKDEREKGRGYETVVGERPQIRRPKGVIYHPNGMVAFEFDNGTSRGITFSDESFADQLIDSTAGRYDTLNNFFSNTTCLFIGLSLDDPTLRHQLRQNARANPGHYHYYISHLKNNESIDDNLRNLIFESNFLVYNLITLFLDNSGIHSLVSLIKNEGSFRQLCEQQGVPAKDCYYLVGSVGVGKSTTNSHLKSVTTYDEWQDIPPREMFKPYKELTPNARKRVDRWVAAQFYKKNFSLQDKREGIHVVDRTPLDPLTFSADIRRPAKARNLLRTVCPTPSGSIEKGHVIFLCGAVKEIQTRLLNKHKSWSTEIIEDLQNNIGEVYTFPEMTNINTTNRSIEEVVQEVAKVIFWYKYAPVDIKQKLTDIVEAG